MSSELVAQRFSTTGSQDDKRILLFLQQDFDSLELTISKLCVAKLFLEDTNVTSVIRDLKWSLVVWIDVALKLGWAFDQLVDGF